MRLRKLCYLPSHVGCTFGTYTCALVARMHTCRGSAKYLRQLKLDYHKLHGPIPFSWRKMPSLTELNLGASELTGTLPGQWDSAALTTMYLGENRLTGALPAWPAPNLKIFHVGQFYAGVCAGNKLSGTISPHLPTLMPHLTMLMLPCNNLSGTIPPELGSLEQLKTFSVGQNPVESTAHCQPPWERSAS